MSAHGPTEVLVIGGGGHARVCIEALADSGFEVVGCLTGDGRGGEGLPCPVVGVDTDVAAVAMRLGVDRVFVAIGHNATRQAATERCVAAGLQLVTAVSRFAMVSANATISAGAAVLAGAVLNPSAVVGDGAIVNTRASLDHDVVVGRFAHVAVGVALAGGVEVGERVLMGVGSCATPLVRIGDDAVVGAGAAVVRDVPPRVTVVGVPARQRSSK